MLKKILLIIIAVILMGAAFYGGMKYGEGRNSLATLSGQNFFSSDQRQQFTQRGTGVQTESGAGFLAGEVLSKDEQSLTLKLQDGSSRIVFFSGSTSISKMTDGSIDDVEIGKEIMVNGQENSDGSYTAQTIQLSPAYQGFRDVRQTD